jgi:hypothetical protein
MEHKAAESAVVGLCVSLEAVEDLVNHALLKIIDVSQTRAREPFRRRTRT